MRLQAAAGLTFSLDNEILSQIDPIIVRSDHYYAYAFIWINWQKSKYCLFGGAGVSTASGIPDFRSTDGLYHLKYAYNPETILSNTFSIVKLKNFYEFYFDKMIYLDVLPNYCHKALAYLEEKEN